MSRDITPYVLKRPSEESAPRRLSIDYAAALNPQQLAAVTAGVGREIAHPAIKEHAMEAAVAMREHGDVGGDLLLDRLANDVRLKLSREQLESLSTEPLAFTGAATEQVAAVIRRVEEITHRHPRAAAYEPEPIL